MATVSPATVLSQLDSLSKAHELAILHLAQPLSESSGTELSNSSANAPHTPTPESLAADLEHYQSLFSKLRFSYLEQVTKEKFLRSIVGSPPLIVEAHENVELENVLLAQKAQLKGQKDEVTRVLAELETQARVVSAKYARAQKEEEHLARLPAENEELLKEVEELERSMPMEETAQNMPLEKTLMVLREREEVLADMDQQIASWKSAPDKAAELEGLQVELKVLEVQKLGAMAAAKEAKRKKEEREHGGLSDEPEERARWYRAQGDALEQLFGLDNPR